MEVVSKISKREVEDTPTRTFQEISQISYNQKACYHASTWHIDHCKVSTVRLAFNSPLECSSSVQHGFGESTLFPSLFDLFSVVMTDHHSACSPRLSFLTAARSVVLIAGSIEGNETTHFRLISSCTLPTAAPPSNLRLRIAPSSPSRDTLALNTNSL